jgi:hypothetical protein
MGIGQLTIWHIRHLAIELIVAFGAVATVVAIAKYGF